MTQPHPVGHGMSACIDLHEQVDVWCANAEHVHDMPHATMWRYVMVTDRWIQMCPHCTSSIHRYAICRLTGVFEWLHTYTGEAHEQELL